MNHRYLTPALLLAALLGACSSMPKTTSSLDQARNDFRAAQSNPDVSRYAPLELQRASDALREANNAATENADNSKIDNLAYLAKQKIALSQEVAKQKSAEASVLTAGKQRDQMRLDQRTNEADRAKADAAQANQNAQQANLNAQQAQGESAEAQRRTQQAMNDAAAAQARNVQLEAALAELAAKKTERGLVITLGDVLFGTDLSRLNAEGMRTAQKLAEILQQYPQRTVSIEGFADSTGTTEHNQALSERRAGSVRSALQEMGVPAARISSKGYGESYPVAANDTSSNRQLNRRVEIVLSDDSGKISQR